MAFALPRVFSRKPKAGTYAAAKPKPKPAYSSQTEQEITQSMFNLALAGPRWVGEQMGEDLDEAFEAGDTSVSVLEFIKHPIKTTKSTIRKWTVSKWKNTLQAELAAEYVWKPRLEHFKTQGNIDDDEYNFILEKWAEKPEGFGRDEGFERLEELHKYGYLDDHVWQGIHRQHQWDEFARFRRKPGRYVWEKLFGKRGHLGEGRFYKYSPQKWLGEPLGKALAKTALGKAIAGVREATKNIARKVVDTAKQALKAVGKAVGKAAVQGAKWVVTKVAGTATWAAISSAVGGAIGSLGGPVGTAIGFLAGPIVTKLLGWLLKIACAACGCAAIVFVGFFAFVMVVIFGAFRPPATGGTGLEQLVEVRKTVSPTHIDLGATGANAEVDYTIEVINKTDKEITGGTLVDTHNPDDFLISVWDGGDWVSGVGTWSNITLPPHGSFSKRPSGFIQNTGVERVVVNNASFTGTIDGDSVSAGGSAVVIVGNPSGQPPSGWPTAKGCVTQGPGGSFSHAGEEAVDIGKLTGEAGEPYKIYATHDGTAYAWTEGKGPLSSACGKYVEILSHGGTFRTYYCHLLSHSVASNTAVEKGTELGIMGETGSAKGVHVHYQFDRGGTYNGSLLKMEPSYIPADVRGCSDACNCCFGSQDGACGSAP